MVWISFVYPDLGPNLCKGYQQMMKLLLASYELKSNCQYTMYIARHHKAPIKMAADDTFSGIFSFTLFPPVKTMQAEKWIFPAQLVTKTVPPGLGVTDGWKVPGIVAENNYIF